MVTFSEWKRGGLEGEPPYPCCQQEMRLLEVEGLLRGLLFFLGLRSMYEGSTSLEGWKELGVLLLKPGDSTSLSFSFFESPPKSNFSLLGRTPVRGRYILILGGLPFFSDRSLNSSKEVASSSPSSSRSRSRAAIWL